mgnify:CR=1 FL=1
MELRRLSELSDAELDEAYAVPSRPWFRVNMISTLDGAATTLGEHRGKAVLVVNVASKCGLTPQNEGLERLQQKNADRGYPERGVTCNQLGGQ